MKQSGLLCSIIIVNYNGKKHLEKCFNSLGNLDFPSNQYEIIMVDNGSKDGSVEFVGKKFPKVRVISLGDNLGYVKGNNLGINNSRGKYVVFLNNDTTVDKKWLTELVDAAEKSDAVVFGSKLNDMMLGEIGEGHLIPLLGIEYQTSGDIMKECFWVPGCSMLIKRDIIEKLSVGLDPTYFMYYEDVDLCWRLRNMGYKTMFVPKSVVFHLNNSKSGRMKFLHYRNKIRTFRKNLYFPIKQISLIPIALISLLRCPAKSKQIIKELLY